MSRPSTAGAGRARRHIALPVVVPSLKEPIRESPGFEKKELSLSKLDLLGLCGFGCLYCSSNAGNYLRIHGAEFRALALEQLGVPVSPGTHPGLTYIYSDIIARIEAQIARHARSWGRGETLVLSMLTDAFSPTQVQDGTTMRALELLIEGTSFRIRVLTKNACVGRPPFLPFFARHADRVVVGCSIGTVDDEWAKRVEIGTSPPSKRLVATRALQDAGVPTFGMLCPIFPDVLMNGDLEQLVEGIRPERCETIWAEPFNDRVNWKLVRDTYAEGSDAHNWFNAAFAHRGGNDAWSTYAMDLYAQLRGIAQRGGWLSKLKYLVYEANLTAAQAPRMGDLAGVLLQSQPGADGLSQNAAVAALQRTLASA